MGKGAWLLAGVSQAEKEGEGEGEEESGGWVRSSWGAKVTYVGDSDDGTAYWAAPKSKQQKVQRMQNLT